MNGQETTGNSAASTSLRSLFVVALAEGADVVDLAGVVEVVLDHRVDQPAGSGVHAPWRGARAHELGIVGEGVDAGAEAAVAFAHPFDDLVRRGRAIDAWE